jgi:adenosylcobalamin-dependent ribonucleoside-triphosphate reductase
MTDVNWGPTGQLVYERTYSRVKPDGTKETWPETVERVVDGNLALVDERHQLPGEREKLIEMMSNFQVLPAGRHLWASGVTNAQHLFNCWVAGWTEKPSDHFEFTFMRLMEGGGVGANYSNKYLAQYPAVKNPLKVEIVCDSEHPDYQELAKAGLLSIDYNSDWAGAFQIEDSREGWAAALVDLIDTHYRDGVEHDHRVYDVTRVRPAGAKLKTFGGRASGPMPLAKMLREVSTVLTGKVGSMLTGIDGMEIDHAIAQCVVAGGVRRSARMAMMHWADPQIEKFMTIKQESLSHWTTNISVEVDDTFWYQAKQGPAWHASKVMSRMAVGMVRNGEPGFWDSSLSNTGEPNPVVCTNPCGEITLEPWEPCNLGHVNMAGFLTPSGKTDYLSLLDAHRLMTRFLIRATFSEVGDPKSREVLDRNRRIGVGHFGVASFLALTGKKYSKAPADKHFKNLLRELAREVDRSAEEFCHDLRIPVPVKKRTIAPTGTIAKMPGVSEGVHPIFAKYFIRRVRLSKVDPDQVSMAEKYAAEGFLVEDDMYADNTSVVSIPTKDSLVQAVVDRFGRDGEEIVEAADDLSLQEMLAFQALYQTHWADNAVSFTANVDPALYKGEQVQEEVVRFAGKLKGATIFPEASMPQAPYERLTKEEYEDAQAKQIADGVDEECGTGGCPVR